MILKKIPETRGRKSKYDFSNMKVMEARKFKKINTSNLMNCAKSYAENKELAWQFRCYRENGFSVIVRVK